MTQVQYLGYIIDEQGVHVDPAKIQVIRDWPSPTTLIELHNFLGLATLLSQKAFTNLKDRLRTTLVLALPDLQQPFEVEEDAFDYAIRAVLTQHEHPVACHSETLSEIIQKYPTYDKEMKNIRSCIACAIAKLTIKKQGLYTLLPTPSRPWESISMDYMSGPPSTKHGNNCVFVVVHKFSKMAIMVACKKNIIAEATAKLFFERVWVHFGIPQSIVLDWDNRFLSTFSSSLWSMLDTKLTKSTTFHPQTDGQTDVVNRMIVHIPCMYNSKHPRTWEESLPYVQYSYNRALHSSTSHNLFQVGLGFQPLCPIDVAMPFAATHADAAHVQYKTDKANSFIEHI
eukprot:PITA_28017